MAIPAVTCGANQSYAYSASSRTISLTATATNSPTLYTWTMLDVPDGSTANVGANGDFTDGVSTVQNPSFDIEGAVEGSWTVQCIATNGDGPSNPAIDRDSGQTTATVRTQRYDLEFPGNKQYNWAISFFIDTLKKIEAAIWGNRSPLTTKGDVNVYGTANDRLPVGSNNQVLTADSAQALGVKWATVATGGGQTNTVAGSSGITNTGDNVDAVLAPTYGALSNTICQGNDSRLSDARTPTSHATSHKSAGGDSIKLDELAAPTDVTTLDATTGAHGLLPKLGGGTTNFLRADGTWATPAGGSSATFNHETNYLTLGASIDSDISTVLTNQPVSATNSPSGYGLTVYRNGRLMKRVTTLTNGNYMEFTYTNGTKTVAVKASGLVDEYDFIYWS